ncbi:MAG: AbrB/MazE/SpoVT family DNA-binding domain-containing protein [Kiritimatiellae bacterium]|nr:AbrB/MazE/SpoVT family DNA-binding domain-containing protein [Kiritimatiellia bacterium]
MTATLSVKGQITMPKPIREKCGLEVGDKLNFLLRDDGVLELVPIKQPASRLKGMLTLPEKAVSIEEMNVAIAKGACGHERD